MQILSGDCWHDIQQLFWQFVISLHAQTKKFFTFPIDNLVLYTTLTLSSKCYIQAPVDRCD